MHRCVMGPAELRVRSCSWCCKLAACSLNMLGKVLCSLELILVERWELGMVFVSAGWCLAPSLNRANPGSWVLRPCLCALPAWCSAQCQWHH